MGDTWTSDDGRVSLYCADCRDVLPTLKAGSVDAVVTDPPYGLGKAEWDRWMPVDWFGAVLSALRATGAAYVFGPSLGLSHFQTLWELRGIRFRSRAVWVYEDGPRCSTKWTSKHEDCLVYHGPKHKQRTPREPSRYRDPRWGDTRLVGDVWARPRVLGNYSERVDHPTQKPVSLMMIPVEASGETIADPFMGSGTTGAACIRTGRRFIGIEKERRYFDIAVGRIERALSEAA